jgi:predicted membrane protein
MKMHIWGIFWGVLFILIGLNIILRTFFNINVPFFRIAFALLVIFIGVKIMFPSNWSNTQWRTIADERTTMFSEQVFSGEKVPSEHSVVFGSAKIDLTKIDVSKNTVKIKVDTVFGGTEIKIDPLKPVKITASAAFGGVQLPNGNAAAFGTSIYQSDSFKDGEPALLVEVSAVFGGVDIKK